MESISSSHSNPYANNKIEYLEGTVTKFKTQEHKNDVIRQGAQKR